jgi:cyclophilin family peptidyl-prolyl cis-trans isomerase
VKIFQSVFYVGVLCLGLTPASRGKDAPQREGIYAEFTTPRGVMTCELFFEQAPLTVTNFVGLAEGTLGPAPRKPFFDGLTFHRVAPGFVVQGGDPLGTGEGGPGYVFPDEFVPGLRHDAAGVLAMANSGPDTNGSQFFFTLGAANRLNYLHSVFGRVVDGIEVLSQIKAGDAMSVKIIRHGGAAERFRADETTFAKLIANIPRAAPPAFDDPAGLLQTDPPRAKILEAKLKNFTRFTGVPLYARLYDKFQPEHQDQTREEFVRSLGSALSLSAGGALAVWFADDNDWHLFAPGRTDLKLTTLPPDSSSPEPAAAEEVTANQKRRVLAVLNEVIDGLMLQLEPKRSAPDHVIHR